MNKPKQTYFTVDLIDDKPNPTIYIVNGTGKKAHTALLNLLDEELNGDTLPGEQMFEVTEVYQIEECKPIFVKIPKK